LIQKGKINMNLLKYNIRNKTQKDFIICGHRGDPCIFPENTIPSLISAVKNGANAIEVDLCITSDDVVILWHDWDPETVEARLRFNGLESDTEFTPYMEMRSKYNFDCVNTITHKEVIENYAYRSKDHSRMIAGDNIPNLGSFLDFVRQNEDKLKYVFLDIKCPSNSHQAGYNILQQIEKQIKDMKPIFVVESFSKMFLLSARLRFDTSFLYGVDSAIPPGFIFNIDEYSMTDTSVLYEVSVPLRPTVLTWKGWITYKRVINRNLKLINKNNWEIKTISATINDEDEMKYLIRAGVAGIQTNYPKLLAAIIKDSI